MKIDKKEKSYGWELLESMPKGTTLYTVLRHVSKSGMMRILDVFVIDKTKESDFLQCVIVQEHASCAKNAEQESRWGGNYKETGCGMDMGFHLVHSLGMEIHNDGYYFTHQWI